MTENERFETLGDLYEQRFHRLRPGKDESPMAGRASSDPENVELFNLWVSEGTALSDALACIVAHNKYIDKLEARL